ncbi:MAG: hypothetical protein LH617_07150, partial [Ramlibacter sp.]|nr:hypothetical protein [Ramlibacter sp.]
HLTLTLTSIRLHCIAHVAQGLGHQGLFTLFLEDALLVVTRLARISMRAAAGAWIGPRLSPFAPPSIV